MRVSGRKKLLLNVITKIILAMLLGVSAIFSIVFFTYKPVYKVAINNIDSGYVASKRAMEKAINNFILNGDSENTAYVIMNATVDYEMMLVKKDVALEEEKIFASIKDLCDVYHKVYAVNVADEEKYIVETMEDAEKIKNEIDEKQAKFSKKVEVAIVEKNLLDYDVTSDIEVAVADIIEPLKKQNDEMIRIRTQLASARTVSKELLQTLKDNLQELSFGKPVEGGIITSKYGWRSMGYHYGLDIGVALGTPIHASESGVVTYSAWSGNYGYLVKIQHTGGYETYYAHCSKLVAEVGDEVNKGDLIAYVGSTGRSTGPHVHLEVRYEGKTLDPEVFVYGK